MAAATLLTGCLVIPVDYTEYGSRGNVTEKTAATLQPGTTTKEEILLRLGEPDWKSPEDRQIGYAWSKVKAVWFVGGYYSAAGGEISQGSELRLSFDADDKLVSVDVVSHWNPLGNN